MFEFGSYGYIALKDLKTATTLYRAGDWNPCMLYCQQCIEKILKQYIQCNVSSVDRTLLSSHKLLRLANATGISQLCIYRDKLSTITYGYFDGRYPGIDYTDYTEEEALSALQVARDIVDIVAKACSYAQPNVTELSFGD